MKNESKMQIGTFHSLRQTMEIAKCLLLALYIAFGMSSAWATTGTDVPKPPEKVRLQLKWNHQFQFAGYYAAIEKGFYAEEGLNVTLRQFDPNSSYIEDVLQGKAQYGTADSGLLLYHLQGKPVVLVAQIFQHSPQILMTRKDSGIKRPRELAGKRVMLDFEGHDDTPINGVNGKCQLRNIFH